MSFPIVPIPKVPIHVRVATLADVPFMDALQKQYGRALGYMTRKMFEGYVDGGNVLVAEEVRGQKSEVSEEAAGISPRLISDLRPLTSASPLGYIISKDRYLKRDELGVIYQLCVSPGHQRGLVGATLVREAFARSAYGCRLYCCWCAQDLEANHFWESLGFVPIAFRAGSTGKRRVHIFWQKRIVQGDGETKWWYPFQTNAGAIREDRLVFPIPPGVHWSEVKAVELPGEGTERRSDGATQGKAKTLPGPSLRRSAAASLRRSACVPPPGKVGILVGGRIKYVDRPGYARGVAPVAPAAPAKEADVPALVKAKKPKSPARKLDAKYVAAARELRDRWLEHVNREGAGGAGELAIGGNGKYEVTRALPNSPSKPTLLLPAA